MTHSFGAGIVLGIIISMGTLSVLCLLKILLETIRENRQ